jgi:hypothetical protein
VSHNFQVAVTAWVNIADCFDSSEAAERVSLCVQGELRRMKGMKPMKLVDIKLKETIPISDWQQR